MKRPLFSFTLFSCLILSQAFSPIAHAGPGGGNGGFLGENAKLILSDAIKGLKDLVPYMADQRINGDKKSLILETLDHVILKKSTPEQNKLILDYPRVQNPRHEIYVYESFNLVYDQTESSDENVSAVQRRLLREISHLWGMNDPESIEFAKTLWAQAVTERSRVLQAAQDKKYAIEQFTSSPLEQEMSFGHLSASIYDNWSYLGRYERSQKDVQADGTYLNGCLQAAGQVIKEAFLDPEIQKLAQAIRKSSGADDVNVKYIGHYDAKLKSTSFWNGNTYTITYEGFLYVSEGRGQDYHTYRETNEIQLKLSGQAIGTSNHYNKDSENYYKPSLKSEVLIQSGACAVTKAQIIEQLKKLSEVSK